jgi:hypothetical protein
MLPAEAQRTLTRETFQGQVRPVLNAILNDFYQMIGHFPDFPKELVPLIEKLDTLTTDKETLRETCPRLVEKKCQPTLTSLRQKLVEIKLQALKVQGAQRQSASLHLNSLSGQRIISEFDTQVEEIKGYLDNADLILAANLPQRRETFFILKELDELNTLVSLSLVEFIPFLYREEFRHFYFNFVHPIQLQISKNKNYEFLNRNVNSLNFAINLLNMNLTKRNKKTPEGMGPFLSVMHNRWNSLLRYYF